MSSSRVRVKTWRLFALADKGGLALPALRSSRAQKSLHICDCYPSSQEQKKSTALARPRASLLDNEFADDDGHPFKPHIMTSSCGRQPQ